jgi:hypothetical protein
MVLLLASVSAVAFVVVTFVVAIGRHLSMSGYRGPVSDHFDGRRFYNQRPVRHGGPADLLRWMARRQAGAWRRITEAAPGPPPREGVGLGAMRTTRPPSSRWTASTS